MPILVTGGTGFVASNIIRTLAEQGEQIISFDINPLSDLLRAYIKPWADRVTFIQGDLLKQDELEGVLDHDIKRIVHAAVFTGLFPNIEAGRSKDIIAINVMGTTNLLEVARKLSVQRFLYVSSVAVYGNYQSDKILTEESIPLPRTLYAVTKYASELLTRRYGELHDFPTVSVRLGSPYGPMEQITSHRANQSLLKEWTGNIIRGEPIEVGDRSAKRVFSYVRDIAGGICAVLTVSSLSHDIYNISTGEQKSLEEIIEVLCDLYPELQIIDKPMTGHPQIGNILETQRFMSDVGYRPRYDLRSGLQEYMAWRHTNNFIE